MAASCPDEATAGWLSVATWHWLSPILRVGYRRPLEQSDLGSPLPKDCSGPSAATLELQLHTLRKRGPLTQGELLSTLFRTETAVLCVSGTFKLVSTLLQVRPPFRSYAPSNRRTLTWSTPRQFVGPLAIAGIISYVEAAAAGATLPSWGGMGLGYWWLLALVIGSFSSNVLRLHADMMQMRIALRGRSALILVIFGKCTAASAAVLDEVGSGKIANMISSDAMMAALLLFFTHEVWRSPLVIAIALAMLYAQLGAAAFVALGACVALLPAQVCECAV